METNSVYTFAGQIGKLHQGKVRNNWKVVSPKSNILLVSETTDRISVFDIKLDVTIPRKGEILNAISNYMMDQMTDIIPVWKILSPHPNTIIGKCLDMIPLEVIVRYRVLGSAWDDFCKVRKEYNSDPENLSYAIGQNTLYSDTKKGDLLQYPVVEYTTKAKKGSDTPITRHEIIRQEILTIETINEIDTVALQLFNRARSIFKEKGIELQDGKIELGYDENGQLTLADEIFNADSCRLRLLSGADISKQVARDFILKNNGCQYQAQLKSKPVIKGLTKPQVLQIENAYKQLYLSFFDTPLPETLSSGAESAMFHLTEKALKKL
jgi:phosphoribosylaminoimidazole-succinocarboxamide synthase